jgi:hypothetical protein
VPVRFDTAIAALAVALALGSAGYGARVLLANFDDARDRYGRLQASAREDEIERSLGFEVSAWEQLAQSVGADDRYTIVSDALEQHEVRNYAAYLLLPAIQVSTIDDADVVVYYATDPPEPARCVSIGTGICVQRRETS